MATNTSIPETKVDAAKSPEETVATEAPEEEAEEASVVDEASLPPEPEPEEAASTVFNVEGSLVDTESSDVDEAL